METKRNILEELKGKHPFRVPEGYMAGLTNRIMSKIPDQVEEQKPRIVSLRERMRPLIYLAAVFVGLIFLFEIFVKPQTPANDAIAEETLQEQEQMPEALEENEEYLEYLQQHYYSNLLAESLDNGE